MFPFPLCRFPYTEENEWYSDHQRYQSLKVLSKPMTSASEEQFPSFWAQSQINYEPLVSYSLQDQHGFGSYEMASALLLDSRALQSDHR